MFSWRVFGIEFGFYLGDTRDGGSTHVMAPQETEGKAFLAPEALNKETDFFS